MNVKTVALAGLALVLQATGATARADAKTGEEIFKNRCVTCHSLTPGLSTVAPDLRGVVGRKAGSLEDYRYSAALKSTDIIWTPDTLEQWLRSPHQVATETEMSFPGLKGEKERAAVIEFLKGFK
jgi:cytochrome c